MPLDPEVQALIAADGAGDGPAFSLGVTESRAAEYDFIELCGPEEPVVSVVDHLVAVDGGEIGVRVYTPEGAGPFPCLVYFHGGGWVAGDLNTMDRPCRMFANGAGCVVASVDYRRAPEHRYPIAADDSFAATKWVAENAAELNVDPDRIAVGGDSAGGNLAAVVSQMARDAGGPPLAFQLLIYPVIDHRFDTVSYRELADGYALTLPMMVWFWEQYLADPADGAHPYASPIRATSLAGLPPAAVYVAAYDPLRDEGIAYADALTEAGVSAEIRCFDGLVHGYLQMGAVSAAARQAVADTVAALRAGLQPR
jgi:acetyl esterase